MRVQYGWLIYFIVALVTFEELDYVFSCAHSDFLYGLLERVLELGVLGNLKYHLETHSGENTYKYRQCDFASVQAGDLRTHLKNSPGRNIIQM